MKILMTMYVTVIIVMATPWVVQGGIFTYIDEAAFIAAAPLPLNMQSFEGLAVDNYTPTSRITQSVPGFGDLVAVNYQADYFGLSVWDQNPTTFGGHATDGVQHVVVDCIQGLEIRLNDPVNALGLSITDWGDWGTGTLTYSMGGQNLFSIALTPRANDNELFFGAINTTQLFDTVTLSHNILGEAYSIDEVYYGVVPVPGAVLLGILGLGAVGIKLRKFA